MIDSDASLQALDHRLQIDRVLALDPLAAVPGKAGGSGAPRSAGTSASANVQQPTLAERLPLGRVVVATVVAVPDDDHVVADIERWRVSMAWPRGAGGVPRPGQDIALRVLAHRPMLLFQSVDDAVDPLERGDDPPRSSAGALQLSRQATAASKNTGGAIRFTEPIIDVEIVSLASGDDAVPSTDRATRPAPAPPTTDRIALDDVIVAKAAANGPPVEPPRTLDPSAMPIVLQGPAWAGQPMELVVRRERADDVLDNPVLDHWCGEIDIDLPLLGRVSGHLAFSMQGLRIRLEGEDATTVAAMSEATASLAAALADTGLRVHALSAGHAGARTTGGGRG